MKKCFKCNKNKELKEFYKHPQMPDGHVNKCKDCNKADVRKNYAEKREEKRAYDSHRQRYSFQRIFLHRYMNIKHRCEGKISGGRYVGIPYCDKETFLAWCYDKKQMNSFIRCWNHWRESGFKRKYTPSVDRIVDKDGYIPRNMQWLSSVNNTKKHYKKEFVYNNQTTA